MRITTLALAALLAAGHAATAQTVTVVHAIPGLPAPVDVLVDGNVAFSFDFRDVQGPVSLPAGPVQLEVQLNGATVLSANPTLAADTDYTVVAHLTTDPNSPIALALFTNDLGRPARGEGRVIVRHLADAPAVDVVAQRVFRRPAVLVPDLSNPNEASADVDASLYFVSLEAAGTGNRAFGPVRLFVREGKITQVLAIGELGTPSFGLLTIVRDAVVTPPSLTATVQGTSCGGSIGVSTTNPTFGTAFDVTLSGGTADAFGFLHIGLSDERFLIFSLPLSLDRLGAPGCALQQSTEVVRPVHLDGTGGVSSSITLPVEVSRRFDDLHFQYSYVDRSANRLGLVLSDYVTVERQ